MRKDPEWIEWDKERYSACPVPSGNDVEVRFLDGTVRRDTNPEGWTWYNYPGNVTDSDIVAYRDWTVFNEQQDMGNQCWTTIMKHQAASQVVSEPEWIKWVGLTEECPVPDGRDVEVKFDDGTVSRNNMPEEWDWRYQKVFSFGANIIAYRDWTAFYKQQEKQMTGQQFKQQRNHPAAALAEQLDSEQKEDQDATVADLIDILTRDQQLFALGYLSAKLANK